MTKFKAGLYMRKLEDVTIPVTYLFYHLVETGNKFPTVISNVHPYDPNTVTLTAEESEYNSVYSMLYGADKFEYIENVEQDFYGTHFIADTTIKSMKIERRGALRCAVYIAYGDENRFVKETPYIAEAYIHLMHVRKNSEYRYDKRGVADVHEFLRWLTI